MVVAVAASSEFAAFEPPVGHSHGERLSNILAAAARDAGNALYGRQAFVQNRERREPPVVSNASPMGSIAAIRTMIDMSMLL